MKTVQEIVKEYLILNGSDGLAGKYCGCGIGELMPCDDCGSGQCVPAYQRTCSKCQEVIYTPEKEGEVVCEDCRE